MGQNYTECVHVKRAHSLECWHLYQVSNGMNYPQYTAEARVFAADGVVKFSQCLAVFCLHSTLSHVSQSGAARQFYAVGVKQSTVAYRAGC